MSVDETMGGSGAKVHGQRRSVWKEQRAKMGISDGTNLNFSL